MVTSLLTQLDLVSDIYNPYRKTVYKLKIILMIEEIAH